MYLYSRARAVTVNDWSLRILQELGVAERVKEDMDIARSVTWKTHDDHLVLRLVPSQDVLGHPPAMMIYQPEMEAVIRENAAGYDSLDVRFGHCFTGLTQDADGVTLMATDADGIPYALRVRHVVGADGGSSRVRENVGLTMVGATRPRRWMVIDGEVLQPWPDCDELVFWSDPVRPVVDIPLAKGNHRWEIPLGAGEVDEDYATEDHVWERLSQLGISRRDARIKGWAFYSHHVRHVDAWRRGRVVLIGDAAHLMPPWAGQGMQSGIRDAHNVAWKLAAICQGRADEALLDTVESERRPHVQMLTTMSQRLGQLVEADNPLLVRVRNALGPVLMHMPGANRILLPRSSTIRFQRGWVTGTPGRRNALGRMIPQPTVFDRQGREHRFDDLVGSGFVVIGADADLRDSMTAHQVAAWAALGARFVTVRRSFSTADDPDVVIDTTGSLTDWMKRFHARVLVVRPDRFVAATDATGLDVPAPRGNLDRTTSATSHAPAPSPTPIRA
ncbi:MAG TPA: FAD-dependent monooxygenase [Ornithinibacter sp.]|uniref:FAD-dependent monooxygenase n=1 Tax=Ornithinibacter sp. TaxID=2862748 RepID=UPI002BA98FCA|nr:FAD-dependent monooxygenase [Ornithinibacter sp.]HQV83182.1 FAD-dependent monooxygenase [Ornithinibacter sp.]HQW74405.1 FAD-dependent monooxygenase [Ornithinibacter sp.]HQZ10319.1 FAD-dependent monooxygenase [Ornithinibacter sp.]HRA26362.1 FAD-dependent monooxygenase [Ornithinibacter sp.]